MLHCAKAVSDWLGHAQPINSMQSEVFVILRSFHNFVEKLNISEMYEWILLILGMDKLQHIGTVYTKFGKAILLRSRDIAKIVKVNFMTAANCNFIVETKESAKKWNIS